MWQQISFVIGSVLGSGIFILPFYAGKYGFSGIIGFIVISILFILLSYLFSEVLCPFDLIKKHFGQEISFFVAWSYWAISWISTIVVLKEIVLYTSNIICFIKGNEFIIESFLVIIFTTINCFGTKKTSIIETFLSIIKIICLLFIPLLCFFNSSRIDTQISYSLILQSLPTFVWCYVGVECASMISQNKKGIVLGMIIVFLIYLINLTGIFFLLGYSVSYTVYAQALSKMSYNPNLLNFIISIICIGTLNSWIVASGMCAFSCAKTGIFPIFLTKKNQYDSAYLSILLSSLGLIPLSFLLRSKTSFDAINQFLSLSSGIFLLFYSLFALAFYLEKKSIISLTVFICLVCILLCSGGISYQLIVIASGIPLLMYQKIKRHENY